MQNEKYSRKSSSEFKKILMVAVLCSFIGALAAAIITTSILYGRQPSSNKTAPQTPKVIQNQEQPIPAIAREVTPAVVGIVTVSIDYDFFYRPIRTEAVGSGVVVNPEGYIITNDHVVGNANEITVFLNDGRKYKAKRLYTDPELDLAVIRIDAKNLTCARLGDSGRVVVGDLAVAIGNPLGLTLQRTVTAGIISAKGRTVMVRDRRGEVLMQDLIQTDASINPGNSGGPLVNGSGEIIGINTIKASQAEAIGFSIPVNIVKPILKSVLEKGRFDKPYLGIEGIDKDMAKLMNVNINIDSGIYVVNVEKDSPADGAGIKKGDIIIKLAGTRIDSMAKLRQVMYNLDINKKYDIELYRNGFHVRAKIVPVRR
ncbi:MAG: serine protease Do [Tepidanaerobacteraceae bacterium]|nr:serine protease Do [Tepidanaerobacteraceae bacterium]